MKKYALSLLLPLVAAGCASLSSPTSDWVQCPQFDTQKSLLMGHMAELAYETKRDRLSEKLSARGFSLDDYTLEQAEYGTRGFLAYNDDTVVLTFTGTEDVKDWLQNAQVWTNDRNSHTGCEQKIAIHNGFYRAVRQYTTDEQLAQRLAELSSEGRKVYFTGHSLGGALTTILAHFTEANWADRIHLAGVYTFGQPLVGDDKFKACYNARLKDRTFRYVTEDDLVPRARATNDYEHVGTPLYFNHDGQLLSQEDTINLSAVTDYLQGDFLKDHSMATYNGLLEQNKNVDPFNGCQP